MQVSLIQCYSIIKDYFPQVLFGGLLNLICWMKLVRLSLVSWPLTFRLTDNLAIPSWVVYPLPTHTHYNNYYLVANKSGENMTLISLSVTYHMFWSLISLSVTSHMYWSLISLSVTYHMFWSLISLSVTSHMYWSLISLSVTYHMFWSLISLSVTSHMY